MKMRFMVATNVALACVMMGLNSGCKGNKSGGGSLGTTPWDNADGTGWLGDDGLPVDGRRFEDIYTRVQDVSFAPVYFAFDSYALAPQELAKISQVAQHLQSNSRHVLVIEGHCDIRGSNEYNLGLGENRALSIRSHLSSLGVGADRIQTRSYGSEKPAVMGSGEAVWRLNRRGEFALYQK